MKNVPKLRFKGFSSEWKVSKLGTETTWSSGGTPSKQIESYWGGEIPWISASSMRGTRYSDSDLRITESGVSSSKLAVKGDLLLLVRGSMLFNKIPVGIATRSLAFNQDVKSITPKKSITSEFLLNWFAASENKIMNMVSGTGIGAGKLDTPDMLDMNLHIPSIQEQTKIADFLTAIDDRISQLSQKCDGLAQYKKGVMQKIFSQELRFKDEKGRAFPAWEEKTLGEICNIKRGASPRPISDRKWFSDKSTIGWVRISDVSKSNKFLNETEQYLSDAGVSKSRLVKQGSIIMSICATIGKPIYTKLDACIHDGFVVFEELRINHEYLYYYLMFIEKKWYQYGQPGSQVNLNSDIVSNELIFTPTNTEQEKIAGFLSAVDEKISQAQAQLAALKQYKQGLLQQMFV